jgi:hypothetical protein
LRAGLSPEDAMYRIMFETMDKLKDPITGGYGRYYGDSYENSRFWTPSVWNALAGKDEEGNLNLWTNQKYRDPQGRIHYIARNALIDDINNFRNQSERNEYIARWMHPNTQAAAIAFRRATQTSQQEKRNWYMEKGKRDLIDALRMITRGNEYTIRPSGQKMEITKIAEGIAPECYVTNKLACGKEVTHVGPWGPLFWSAAGLRHMLSWAKKCREN